MWVCKPIQFTFQIAPSDSPQISDAMGVSPTAIFVWVEEVPPAEQNGVIIKYEIQYIPLETCSDTVMFKTVSITDTSLRSITLTGLEEYAEYNISVRAYTSVGPGPYSDGILERTLVDGKNTIHPVFNLWWAIYIQIQSVLATMKLSM